MSAYLKPAGEWMVREEELAAVGILLCVAQRVSIKRKMNWKKEFIERFYICNFGVWPRGKQQQKRY